MTAKFSGAILFTVLSVFPGVVAASDGPPIGVSLMGNPTELLLAADEGCLLIFDGEQHKERGKGGAD